MSNKRRGHAGNDSGEKRSRRHKHLIHKIQADSFDSDSGYDDQHSSAARHQPPALRLECPVGTVPHSGMSFATLATCHGVMSWGSTAPDALQHPTEGWSWKTLPPPPAVFHRRVNSYITNFMTAPSKGCMGTYSFNTKDSLWRWNGEWALPFIGQAHFDSELNAWVGLRWDGYIFACQVASHSCHNTTPTLQLDCQTTKEKLFCKDRNPHTGASLTYMGTGKLCLVQRVKREGVEEALAWGDHDGCVLHISIFGLKYNHKGEL
ncbi:hypothetical protein VPH35_041392 [Triticum aestivum]